MFQFLKSHLTMYICIFISFYEYISTIYFPNSTKYNLLNFLEDIHKYLCNFFDIEIINDMWDNNYGAILYAILTFKYLTECIRMHPARIRNRRLLDSIAHVTYLNGWHGGFESTRGKHTKTAWLHKRALFTEDRF